MKLLAGVLSLLLLTSCNYYTASLCDSSNAVDLGAYTGPLTVTVDLQDGSTFPSGAGQFSKDAQSGTYKLAATAPGGNEETLFTDAVACKIGAQIILEQKYTSVNALAFANLDSGKIEITFPMMDTAALDADQIPYTDLGSSDFGGLIIQVDNTSLSTSELLKYYTVPSVIFFN